MRIAEVYRNGELTGLLTEHSVNSYEFSYDDKWFMDEGKPAISLTLPKTKKTHHSQHLFPFFFNMLSEGVNKQLQCRQLRIDERDSFGLLMATAKNDTIGAITVKQIHSEKP
ncbi:HipA N-terminal domain-containing protein [Flagellimonas halotolerans]|uniref:HipA N-terminal domain-containing protein n=1 Tax=Flagellimonas halotolerans TaxID=3112164 RepID=A0ABU6IRM7_9FLAO|nr:MULTISPECIES: HipA N-terminal domain-containing protein [unclassified Allomuricauda]MEC3965698.1 HipA N-terminal domain-containing protein [Muricauda sp. SYSU M86414]MEC4265565.1 HipA N-terminal domain-containing protein [Muricauda sp. SYSU M84420]